MPVERPREFEKMGERLVNGTRYYQLQRPKNQNFFPSHGIYTLHAELLPQENIRHWDFPSEI